MTMDQNDRQAIEGLFSRLSEVERNAAPRDDEAEAFIGQQVARQPAAPYFMAQTIVVQEQALEAAQARIEELEAQAAQPQGDGFLGGLFGSSSRRLSGAGARGSVPRVGRAPLGAPAMPAQSGAAPGHAMGQRGGGSFLGGAAQTAMGVAGGLLLGNMIGGMLAGDANAADAPAEAGQDMAADDAGMDSDFGDMDF
jgi:uncharacterized protein